MLLLMASTCDFMYRAVLGLLEFLPAPTENRKCPHRPQPMTDGCSYESSAPLPQGGTSLRYNLNARASLRIKWRPSCVGFLWDHTLPWLPHPCLASLTLRPVFPENTACCITQIGLWETQPRHFRNLLKKQTSNSSPEVLMQ